MTGSGSQVPSGDPMHDPLSLELLADLHAGVLDEQLTAVLRRRVAGDEQARTVLAALDATVADLADLADLPRQGGVRMPDAVALRLDAALAAETQRSIEPTQRSIEPTQGSDHPAAQVVDFGARRRRSAGWFGMGLVAAAAAMVVVASSVAQLAGVLEIPGTPRGDDARGTATGVQPSEPLALTSADLTNADPNRSDLGAALNQALADRGSDPLSPAGRIPDCLAANGVLGTEPLGALEITLDGRRGVLIVLPAGRIAQFRLLVVGLDCGPGNPSQLADTVVGRR